ncbi:hypothetical protein ACO3UB_08490 (plasmid) [Methanocaldococcus sp. 16A]
MSPVWKVLLILYGLYCLIVIFESVAGFISPGAAGQAVGSMLALVIMAGLILNYIYKKLKN